jgi:dipeptidase
MGELADTYGFYPVLRGDSDAALKTVPNEGGESLLVGDMAEAWIFHIMRRASKSLLPCYNRKPIYFCVFANIPLMLTSDGGEGAIWCAQRVEDNEFVVVANMMVIRLVDLADTQVNA